MAMPANQSRAALLSPSPHMAPPSSPDPSEAALHWFVRCRAENFSDGERHALEAWLAASPEHRRHLQELERTWQTLDLLQERRHELPLVPPRQPGRARLPAWTWLSALVAGGCAALYFLFLLPAALPHYETPAQERRSVTLPDGTSIAMNADSAFAVRGLQPLQIELLRGDIYLEVPPASSGRVEVRLGSVRIRDIGTRFAVQAAAAGGNVAVAEGAVQVSGADGQRQLAAGHSLGFNNGRLTAERTVRLEDVAPWRRGEWLLQETPVGDMVREIARQTGIRVDLPDPAVSSLTVSGRFSMAQAEQMLWAVAEVHGLRLQRLNPRHYALLAP